MPNVRSSRPKPSPGIQPTLMPRPQRPRNSRHPTPQPPDRTPAPHRPTTDTGEYRRVPDHVPLAATPIPQSATPLPGLGVSTTTVQAGGREGVVLMKVRGWRSLRTGGRLRMFPNVFERRVISSASPLRLISPVRWSRLSRAAGSAVGLPRPRRRTPTDVIRSPGRRFSPPVQGTAV